MHSAPRLTGCSGFPSTLMIRPSRFLASTPQPAGHSRQTVAKYEVAPGTIWGLGVTMDRMVSPVCWQPAVAAAAPEVVMILKKSRRFMGSVVAAHAIEGSLGSCRRVLLPVAVDAPTHRQRWRRRSQPDQVEQIVG